ncbi:hypothetical protein THH46_19895 [Pseudomonas sp. NA13]
MEKIIVLHIKSQGLVRIIFISKTKVPIRRETCTTPGGHMWYSVSDGVAKQSYGFASRLDEMFGPGQVTNEDDGGYQETIYEVTLKLTEAQYNALMTFSNGPDSGGFDASTYDLLKTVVWILYMLH